MSGAAGTASTALCKIYCITLMCTESTHTHIRDAHTNSQMHGKIHLCAHSYSRTHKPSSRVNEVLEFLKAPTVRDRLCFIHPLIPMFSLHSSPPHVNFACGYFFLVATFHLTLLPAITVGFSGTHRRAHNTQEGHNQAARCSTPEACFSSFRHIRPAHHSCACESRMFGLGCIWVFVYFSA